MLQLQIGGQGFSGSGLLSVPPSPPPVNPLATSWALRVVANGGAVPSDATISAISDFCNSLDSAGVTSKLKAVNVYAPDSFTEAITPLIKVEGIDPWTPHNFIAGDLTINGLKGNGVNAYLNSGVIPGNFASGTTDIALAIYVSENAGGGCGVDTGHADATGHFLRLYFCADILASLGNSPDLTVASTSTFKGYFCGSRLPGVSRNIYLANSTTPHASFASDANVPAVSNINTAMPVHASEENFVISNYSSRRLSFAAFALGLTQAQSAALFSAVQALRVAFGGGFI